MSNIPEGCKPFNLQEALEGKPVVTRDGRKVKIAGYNPDAHKMHEIIGWANSGSRSWSKDGSFDGTENCGADLFMAPETKDVWVVLWSTKTDDYIRSTAYENEDAAEKSALNTVYGYHFFHGIHKITITL